MTEARRSSGSGAHLDATSIPAGDYIADPTASLLRFEATAFTLLRVRGTIPAGAGTLRIAEGKLSGTGQVAAERIDTGLAARDWHLRSSHYLNTGASPTITLSVEHAELASGHADCRVTVRDASSVVPMTITRLEHLDGRLQLVAETDLDRTVFPMLPPIAGVSRRVHVELTVVAHKA